ncbi:MAG TPA: hypothetical protein VIL46_07045 [Gemmataceae bacterium]
MVRLLGRFLAWAALSLAVTLLGLGVVAGDFAVLILSAPRTGAGAGSALVFLCGFCLGLLATLVLAVAAHEAGHLLGGRWVGLATRFAHVGPITITRERGGWRPGWDPRRPWIGRAVCEPWPASRWRAALFVAAGPLANFAAAPVAALLALAWSPSLPGCWAGLFAVHSAFFGAVNLLPLKERSFPSDGLALWRLLTRPPGRGSGAAGR